VLRRNRAKKTAVKLHVLRDDFHYRKHLWLGVWSEGEPALLSATADQEEGE
jgi:hypothetical protein